MSINAIKDILLDRNKLIQISKIAFDSADTDNSGSIDENELGEILIKFATNFNREPPTKDEIKEVMRHLNGDESGKITFNEFIFLIKDILYAMLEIK
jgi:Ca2+-binding EF-hand superfamily protein